jgi:hypothetical protein
MIKEIITIKNKIKFDVTISKGQKINHSVWNRQNTAHLKQI